MQGLPLFFLGGGGERCGVSFIEGVRFKKKFGGQEKCVNLADVNNLGLLWRNS
jgi:hypothetical protein